MLVRSPPRSVTLDDENSLDRSVLKIDSIRTFLANRNSTIEALMKDAMRLMTPAVKNALLYVILAALILGCGGGSGCPRLLPRQSVWGAILGEVLLISIRRRWSTPLFAAQTHQCEIIQGRLFGKLLEPSLLRRVILDDAPEQQVQPAPWFFFMLDRVIGALALRSLVA